MKTNTFFFRILIIFFLLIITNLSAKQLLFKKKFNFKSYSITIIDATEKDEKSVLKNNDEINKSTNDLFTSKEFSNQLEHLEVLFLDTFKIYCDKSGNSNAEVIVSVLQSKKEMIRSENPDDQYADINNENNESGTADYKFGKIAKVRKHFMLLAEIKLEVKIIDKSNKQIIYTGSGYSKQRYNLGATKAGYEKINELYIKAAREAFMNALSNKK